MSTPACAADPAIGQAAIALPRHPDTTPPVSVCGIKDDSQHVEAYDGRLGPSTASVAAWEPHTVQLQWREDWVESFSGRRDRPGNVAGARWCTGTLIAEDLVLTAAHCFRSSNEDWVTPVRNGNPLPPAELAKLMQVNFGYQQIGTTKVRRQSDVFQIDGLVEFGDTQARVQGARFDYAIVRLKSKDGIAAGTKYGITPMNISRDALLAAHLLTIIQHPDGQPKKVEAGTQIVEPRDALIRYADVDTLGGASGSGILNERGELIGVHTNGGCDDDVAYNYGVSLMAIASASDVIRALIKQ